MFRTGDQVVDEKASDPDIMRVLNPNVGKAKETEITPLRKSVHDANPDYSPESVVVETIYESWLDRYASNWTDWCKKSFDNESRKYSDTWDVPLKTYYYPEPRLRLDNKTR